MIDHVTDIINKKYKVKVPREDVQPVIVCPVEVKKYITYTVSERKELVGL